MRDWLSFRDILFPPIYLVLVFLIALYRRNTNIHTFYYFKYYMSGLFIKLLGGILLCLVYSYYYYGGDTVNYFLDSSCMVKLIWKKTPAFFTILFGDYSVENFILFDYVTDWPNRYWGQKETFFVVKITSIFNFIAGSSFLVTTILFTWFFFGGVWRLFQLFVTKFPDLHKEFAITILFLPSVVFWSSGLLKDTVIFGCIGWFTHAFFMSTKWDPRNSFYAIFPNLGIMLFSLWMIYSIRPFMLFPLSLAASVALYHLQVTRIANRLIRKLLAPVLILLNIGLIAQFMADISRNFGVYSTDKVLERAVVVQDDLRREYYGGNTFDIGSFDPTISGVLGKAHLAISAALFRPFIWEARNPFMVISGLENLAILLLTLGVIFRIRMKIFRYLGRDALLLYGLVFSFFYSFSVGLTTANFGTLVRYRIPSIVFYIAILLVLRYYHKKEQEGQSHPFSVVP